MGNKLLDVGPLELEVLGVLNGASKLSVAEIQASLKASGHKLAYTTVMTVLVRLHKKKLVVREKESRQFLYSTTNRKEASPFKLLERVKNSLFRSEKLKPILSLLESDDELSQAELETLKLAIEARLKSRE